MLYLVRMDQDRLYMFEMTGKFLSYMEVGDYENAKQAILQLHKRAENVYAENINIKNIREKYGNMNEKEKTELNNLITEYKAHIDESKKLFKIVNIPQLNLEGKTQ